MTLDDVGHRLYGLPLGEFVSERNKAAGEARKAGDRSRADAISALPKPSLAAWTINQLARSDRRDVDLLLDSGNSLLQAQRATLQGGDRRDLDEARAAVEKQIARLAEAAARILEERASPKTLERVEETLRGAAITEDGRERLATGTFVKETSETGWDVVALLGADLPARRPSREKPERPVRDAPRVETRDAEREKRAAIRADLREARTLRSELSQRVREAERRQAQAEAERSAAQKELEAARSELADADARIERAENELRGTSGS